MEGCVARAKKEGRNWRLQGKATRGPEQADGELSLSLHSVTDTTWLYSCLGKGYDALFYLHSATSKWSAWVFPNARSQRNEKTFFGPCSLSPPPSQFVPSVLPATPWPQNFNLPCPRRPSHSFTPVDNNRKTHLQTCLGTFRKGRPSLFRPLWMKEVQRLIPVTQALKKDLCWVSSA